MAAVVARFLASSLEQSHYAKPTGLRRRFLESASQRLLRTVSQKELDSSTSSDRSSESQVAQGPEIEWDPSLDIYLARVERLSTLKLVRPSTVPQGFPCAVDTSRVWAGSDHEDESRYILSLSKADVTEIEEALSSFKALAGNNGPDQVSRQTFPLPTLQSKLDGVSKTLHFGRGFTVLRGLEPKKYSPFDNVIIYLGVTNYIAVKRGCQDSSWNMLTFWNTRSILFNFEEHGPGFCFARRPISGSPTSPRSAGVLPMSEDQAEALDMVHFTAVKHPFYMQLESGDMQFINNLALFPARSAFTDRDDQKRDILRLWLRNEEFAWKTPGGLQSTWFEKYGDSERRRSARWSIQPETRRERVIYRRDTCS